MLALSLILGLLTVARLTRLITEDQILVGIRQWTVKRWGAASKATYLIHCPWCMSLWISVPVMPVAVLFPNIWVVAALSVLAGSMVAGLLLDTFTRGE